MDINYDCGLTNYEQLLSQELKLYVLIVRHQIRDFASRELC